MASKIVQSVDRALDILEILVEVQRPITLSEISKKAELNISTAHRLLNTLVMRGFAAQEESGKYKLGLHLFEIAGTLENSMDLKTVVKPYLEEIVEECNETVNLVILDQGEVLYVDQVESTNMIRMFANVGSRGPAHSLGAGKVLLAYLGEEQLEQVLDQIELTEFTANTITDPTELKEELIKIRKQGYAIDFEEMEEGVRCVAAPIRDSNEKVVAAISVSGPNIRITEEVLYEEMVPLVTAKAEEISNKLANLGL
ncbi:IclR family transcriptional regulator [Natroniella sulfidigena]|uniref:IclR family transcriptional regulator n=1 Tax=Natroniella sulfidigena TaxID=723921 RepID=UPI00200AAF8F|nr:IclR family transcriptional regulator [Natroniella sulfidigena]MCK8816713.1 IclR family transcriptional regulator [Natroniella sulfidigena]